MSPASPPAHPPTLPCRYDSSVQELSYKQRPGRLDDPNFHLKCKDDKCLNWTGLPFWEVPTYGLEPPAGRRTNPGDVGGFTAFQVGGWVGQSVGGPPWGRRGWGGKHAMS